MSRFLSLSHTHMQARDNNYDQKSPRSHEMKATRQTFRETLLIIKSHISTVYRESTNSLNTIKYVTRRDSGFYFDMT